MIVATKTNFNFKCLQTSSKINGIKIHLRENTFAAMAMRMLMIMLISILEFCGTETSNGLMAGPHEKTIMTAQYHAATVQVVFHKISVSQK